MKLAQELSQIAELQNESHLDSKKGDGQSISSRDTVNMLDPHINKYTGRPDFIQKSPFLMQAPPCLITIPASVRKSFLAKEKKWTTKQGKVLDSSKMKVWEKNLLMHPPETNQYFDCHDKHQTLKDIKQIVQKIERQDLLPLAKPVPVQPTGKIEGKQTILVVEDNEFIQ
mmetsp:Transcript_11611/g.17587  ORF Transcript_11611/g.17587 Transcript_11611/m.17587 type:complete len:170 (+) Transcript_11611:3836-4345(+)|eukprot:CAMPEP_0170512140 /NCGR_PEP_ID=MMETSP0208-20121228/66684_1 /TAXON_ID=197538 /ORGANISM="Strombidium inclinatum, Strain S3" /LENGTH=169 /DNA_ID=CAMNT_0010795741 /DNA_START=3764 /DNA_END=4273 /DNA_ORIENTATION=+